MREKGEQDGEGQRTGAAQTGQRSLEKEAPKEAPGLEEPPHPQLHAGGNRGSRKAGRLLKATQSIVAQQGPELAPSLQAFPLLCVFRPGRSLRPQSYPRQKN